MMQWAKRGVAVVLAGVLLWAFLQLWIALALALALSYGMQVAVMFILLSLTVIVWLVWFVGAGWHDGGHSARPGGNLGPFDGKSR